MLHLRTIRSGLLHAAGLILMLGMVLTAGVARADVIPDHLAVPSEPIGNETCLECHSQPGHMVRDGQEISIQVDPEAYRQSVHGIISCVRCHAEATEEHIANPEEPLGLPTGRELRVLKSEGCVKCHAGIYEESYNFSFHGVAVRHGDYRAATCVDCHGVHDILPSRNPASLVSRENVAQTCSTAGCHTGAPAGFAEGTEHFVPSDSKSAGELYLVFKFFMALILFDTMKDGPIVMFELLRRLQS